MDLRQLKYFVAVGKLGNVTRAAEQCYVAQPAISVAIQNLEEELGVQLFERRHKRVSLTSIGRVYLQRVEDILKRVDNSVKEMADYRNLERGIIRIGISTMLGAILFPYILRKFHDEHPSIELEVVEEGALTLTTLLEKGELDLGIMVISEGSPQLTMVPLMKSEILACFSAEHSLRKYERISFPRLKDESFLLFKEGTVSRQLILQECSRHQMTPRIAFASNQIATIQTLIELGVGVGFLLEQLVKDNPRIEHRHLTRPLYLEAGLVWNQNRYQSHAAQAFIEAIRRYRFDHMLTG